MERRKQTAWHASEVACLILRLGAVLKAPGVHGKRGQRFTGTMEALW